MKSKTVKTYPTYRIVQYALPISWLVMILLGVAFRANAQQPISQRSGMAGLWKTYRYVDGLANNSVTAILQAEDGTIWFGTWEGVSRYDGKNWTTYTEQNGLAGNTVRALLQDRAGAIWVGTNGGVSRYDGGRWQSYTQANGLVHNDVTALLQDREGAIWVGTRRGISRYDRTQWQTVTAPDRFPRGGVTALMQDQTGTIWVGTMGGLSRYDGKKWQFYAGTIQGWTDIDMNERRLRRGVGGGGPGGTNAGCVAALVEEVRGSVSKPNIETGRGGGPNRPGLVPTQLRVSIRHFAPTQPRFLNPPRRDPYPLPLPDLKRVQYTG
ncbi:hypothetical protein HYR99_28365 [Candidatus Poribacteria bacterium]|nr:hypothetical protein [Candidatus Poribacteria bacterium]